MAESHLSSRSLILIWDTFSPPHIMRKTIERLKENRNQQSTFISWHPWQLFSCCKWLKRCKDRELLIPILYSVHWFPSKYTVQFNFFHSQSCLRLALGSWETDLYFQSYEFSEQLHSAEAMKLSSNREGCKQLDLETIELIATRDRKDHKHLHF